MNFHLLEDSKEVKNAFTELVRIIRSGSKRMNRRIGSPSPDGPDEFRIDWHPEEAFWCALGETDSRYICLCGTKDPRSTKNLSSAVQINPARMPNSRKTEGLFLRDDKGRHFLGRAGKLTKGRSSLGATAFFEQFQGDLVSVEWPDGIAEDVAIIGRIGSPSFLQNLRDFIVAVEQFKSSPPAQKSVADGPLENPEFFGKRKPYQPPNIVHSENTHGLVVNELRRILSVSHLVTRTAMIDLFVSSNSSMTHLFEIKTTPKRSDIYQAIGQLMIHGACRGKMPRRILVIPGYPSADTLAKIHEIGIEVLEYRWEGKKPVFIDLQSFIQM